MNQPKTLELAGSAYYNMLRSCIESWPREVQGDLFGKNQRADDGFQILNAYPIITSKRKRESVSYGNNAAVLRLRRLDEAVSGIDDLSKTSFIGEYHSHTTGEGCRPNVLSDNDLHFVHDEMKVWGKEKWIEILLEIRERKYRKNTALGQRAREYKKKMGVLLRDDLDHGYAITISGFLIDDDMRLQELKVVPRKVKRVIKAT
jgi:hypothetical protein